MSSAPQIQATEEGDDYYHVRFRDPDQFDEIRTPDWADEVGDSVVEGSEVRTGQAEDSDEWLVQSVLIPKNQGEDRARDQAREIVEKIND
ncbi:hypothetical protein [Halomicrobium urmianum]|uniref:hypothetical protein n=1 Tax=Halomicrobium urmianum TaxID=1586233 RepID=UPI001CD9F526|nr:hypothetical protein [Halomicrobium urmianum]